MGEGKEDKVSISLGFGSRVLIIAFGAGIVALGLRPLEARYGSLWGIVKRESGRLLGENGFFAHTWSRVKGAAEQFKVEVEMAQRKVSSTPTADGKEKNLETKKKVDHLSDRDRRELDQLINSLK